ncbi:hypothetical protein JCM11641_001936 [Rhodosporidiobolus odoratus]
MASEQSGGSGSALLLRLFESGFFDVHLAIGYLKTYPNSIGITHYLVNRLRTFEYEDVEFYWPQLCYLVITRPTPSTALENFILERCEEDSHIAVITLWYLQASLSDLANSPKSDQFGACRRILNRVQAIIFTDPPLPPSASSASTPTDTTAPVPSTSTDITAALPPPKVNAPLASFVGIGLLAAVFGMPGLMGVAGRMVVEQGRRIEQVSKDDAQDPDAEDAAKVAGGNSDSGSEEDHWDKGKPGKVVRTDSTPIANGSAKGKKSSSRTPKRSSTQPNYLPGDRIVPSPKIPLSSAHESRSMSFLPSPLITSNSFSVPSTPQPNRASHQAQPSASPFTSIGANLKRSGSVNHALRANTTPSLSVPSLSLTSHSASSLLTSSLSPSSTAQHLSGSTLPGYGLPKPFLSHLLLLQACRSQLDLVRSLQDIATRLVLVPKPARLSSLRAELTVLNHGLPRGCSLGMSTRPPPLPSLSSSSAAVVKPAISLSSSSTVDPSPPPSSSPYPTPKPPTPRRKQARIVRISPSESVVLNSADRAPFVIYVEVLEEDLDFDPDRRSNWEDLRRALRERDGLTSAPPSSPEGVKGEGKDGRASFDGLSTGALGGSTSPGPLAISMPPKQGGTRGGPPFSSSSSSAPSPSPNPGTPFFERAEYALGTSPMNGAPTFDSLDGDISAFEPSGEMDLVEQLYGDVSLRDEPLLTPVGEPEEVEIHNRTADELAWARKDAAKKEAAAAAAAAAAAGAGGTVRRTRSTSLASSVASKRRSSTASSHGDDSTSTSTIGASAPSSRPATKRSSTTGTARPGGRSITSRAPMSLDDYAERMRMAAIMLAQLDASQTASRGVVGAGTAAAGTLVTLPVATVAGIGGVVGYGLGAGLGAVKARLSKKETPAAAAGQAASGTKASLDTAHAAEGTSAIAGQPPLNAQAAALSQAAAKAASTSGSAPSASTAAVGASGSATPAPLPTQRPRVLSPQDAAAIRERIMSEMMALEEERMERMRGDTSDAREWSDATKGGVKGGMEDNAVVMRAVNKDDPSGAVFSESFAGKTARIRAASPFGHLPQWSLLSCIVKTGADLRQEQLAVQLISEFGRIWREEECPAWVCYFRILVTSENSGLVETIADAVSVHSIKKDAYARRAEDSTQVFTSFTLHDHFINTYGPPHSAKFRKAQKAFIESLAAYSVISYLLQLKDRHNGNILVDREGHLVHIDFGFMLSNSPGSLGFEMAPFKLPQDYIDILGGFDSEKFGEFRALFKRCFRDVRKHAERIITLVELMQKDSSLDCFANGDLTSQQLRERFMLSLTQAQVDDYADKLILNSATSSFTKLYDLFQGYSNGIL